MLSAINPMANSVYDFNTKRWKFVDPADGKLYAYTSDNSSVGGSSGGGTHSSQITYSAESPSVSSTNARIAKRGSYASDLSSVVSSLERIATKKNINNPKDKYENIDLTSTAISLGGDSTIARASEEKVEFAADKRTSTPFKQPIDIAMVDDEQIPVRALSRAESIVPFYPTESDGATNNNTVLKSQSIFDVVASVDNAYFSYRAIVTAAKLQNQEQINASILPRQLQQNVQQQPLLESCASNLTELNDVPSIPQPQVMDHRNLESIVKENASSNGFGNFGASQESSNEVVARFLRQKEMAIASRKIPLINSPINSAESMTEGDSDLFNQIVITASTASSARTTFATTVPVAKRSGLYNNASPANTKMREDASVPSSETDDEGVIDSGLGCNEDTNELINEIELQLDASANNIVLHVLEHDDFGRNNSDEWCDDELHQRNSKSQDATSHLLLRRKKSSTANIQNLEDHLNGSEDEIINVPTASSLNDRTGHDSAQKDQCLGIITDAKGGTRSDCTDQDITREDQLEEEISKNPQASDRSDRTDKETTYNECAQFSVDLIVQSDVINTEENSNKVDVISNFEIELYLFELEKATREAEARRKQFIMGLVNGEIDNCDGSIKDADLRNGHDSLLRDAAKAKLDAADVEDEQEKLQQAGEQGQQSAIALELVVMDEVQQSSKLRKTV